MLTPHDKMTIIHLLTREIDILKSAKLDKDEKYAGYVLHLVNLANKLNLENN